MKKNQEFYNSSDWRKFRERYLCDHALCEMCKEEGYTRPATVADHIVPINQGGKKFDRGNIQALCNKHHASKSGKDAHSSPQGR